MGARSTMLQVGCLMAMALSLFMSPTESQAYTDDQQQACTSDAFRLCGSDIPDVDRVTACMVRQRSLLSPPCKVYFRDQPPVLTPVTARVPTDIKPRQIRKAKKPRRAK